MTTILRKAASAGTLSTRDFGLQIKAEPNEEGVFEGYGSIFGNVDSYGDVVEPGAFGASLAKHKREGSKPLLLWQHNADEPIGVWEDLAEDGKGLWGKGRLVSGVRKADEARALMKAGAVQGLSIGYRTVKAEPDGPVLRLKELDLVEVSIVSFPANRRARVDTVKADGADSAAAAWRRFEDLARKFRDGEPPPAKDFEDLLREAGIPKAAAVHIASHGYAKTIRSESEGREKANPSTPDLSPLAEALKGFKLK
jgi:HK97 family phage prohead protease